MAQIVIQLEET